MPSPLQDDVKSFGISGDDAGLINSSPTPGKFKLNYSCACRKWGCWFSAKSKGLKYQDLGIKKKKIQGFERCIVSELKRTSVVAQSPLATVSPSLQPVPDRWAVTLSIVTTDKHVLFYETSQSSIRYQIAKAYSSYQAETFYNFILWIQLCPQNNNREN